MSRLTEKRLFLLDMDGTIYLDETLFPGTVPFLRSVRQTGGRYLMYRSHPGKWYNYRTWEMYSNVKKSNQGKW